MVFDSIWNWEKLMKSRENRNGLPSCFILFWLVLVAKWQQDNYKKGSQFEALFYWIENEILTRPKELFCYPLPECVAFSLFCSILRGRINARPKPKTVDFVNPGCKLPLHEARHPTRWLPPARWCERELFYQ